MKFDRDSQSPADDPSTPSNRSDEFSFPNSEEFHGGFRSIEQVKQLQLAGKLIEAFLIQEYLHFLSDPSVRRNLAVLLDSPSPDPSARQSKLIADIDRCIMTLEKRSSSVDPQYQPLDDLPDEQRSSYIAANMKLRAFRRALADMDRFLDSSPYADGLDPMGDPAKRIDENDPATMLKLAGLIAADMRPHREGDLSGCFEHVLKLSALQAEIFDIDIRAELENVLAQLEKLRDPMDSVFERTASKLALTLQDSGKSFSEIEHIDIQALWDQSVREVFPTAQDYRRHRSMAALQRKSLLAELSDLRARGPLTAEQSAAGSEIEFERARTVLESLQDKHDLCVIERIWGNEGRDSGSCSV